MSRHAGAHSLAALADDWHAIDPSSRQIQACVDVLCSYLRRPWDPLDDNADIAEERVVRETISSVLRQHLQPDASPNWSACAINLSGAHLHDLDLSGARITSADFSGASFTGYVGFEGTAFNGSAEDAITFDGATFTATGSRDWTNFADATFTADAILGISFEGVTFLAREEGRISFHSAHFDSRRDGGLSFIQSTFSTDGAGAISFEAAHFTATNPARQVFTDGQLPDCITFMWATFAANSNEGITFDHAVFRADRGRIRFTEATFVTTNHARITFREGVFLADHDGQTTFDGSSFHGDGTVSFANPGHWNGTSFDWDSDPDSMPPVVDPQQWPPKPRST
ncbi:hypothetical protein A5746_18725 [Mycolicibacterium conceptionense]|nr:hypothetical protein A5746_18725 [Mycolicibacterium conceptionense]